MALEQCPACKKRISSEATTCPKCGEPLAERWSVVQRKKRIKETWLGFAILAVIAGVITLWLTVEAPKPDPCGTASGALTAAEIFVQGRLKSPATASFAPLSLANVAKKACGRWIVGSYVDAQNGFGAKIRTQFLATVERQSEGRWRLIDLTFIR